MPQRSSLRAWIEVDLEAIAHNLDIVHQAHPDAALMPVVKAEAYGHGLCPVARRLDDCGIDFLGVANVGEARRLLHADIRTRPFILGPSFAHEREEIIQNGWAATISSMEEMEHYEALSAAAGKISSLHLALDTGMGREGFCCTSEDVEPLVDRLAQMPHIHIEGVMSHCPSADEDVAFTQAQIAHFDALTSSISERLPRPLRYRHLAASAGFLGYEAPGTNLLRPGLILYGISPLASVYESLLRPALRLYSRVTLVRELPAGHGVSYGSDFVTTRPTRVATIGIGYADGLSRQLAGKGMQLRIGEHLAPMLGRVTMDQIMADVTDSPDVASGDVVEIIGDHQSAKDLARLRGSIPWEVLTNLGPRLPRLYSPNKGGESQD